MALELLFYYFAVVDNTLDRPELSPEDKRRRDRRTPRIAIKYYAQSPFVYLFDSGDEQALLNCCGVDHNMFRRLHQLFEPVFHRCTLYDKSGVIRKRAFTRSGVPKGRKRELDAIGCLGLLLYWYRTRGSVARGTAMAFGLTSSPMYLWLRFSRRVLLSVLQNDPLAMVSPPTEQEVVEYIDAIGVKYPALREQKVWGAADGLKVLLQKSSNWAIQNRSYNGWTADTYVNSMFVFAADGRIRMCTINAPGTWHDSTIAEYGVYDKMEEVFNNYGGRVVVDSAFKLQGREYLIKSSQQDPDNANGIVLNRQATSLRQLSEWGMRMIQGQFPRLKDRMGLEDFGERKVILHLLVLLYNYQASTVGINQILNTFMSKTDGFYSHDRVSTDANNVFDVR